MASEDWTEGEFARDQVEAAQIWAACYGASFAIRAHNMTRDGYGWSEVFKRQKDLASDAAALADTAVEAYYQEEE